MKLKKSNLGVFIKIFQKLIKFITLDQPEMHSYYASDLNNQTNFHMESSVPSHEENETTDVPSSPVTQTSPFDYYSGSAQQVINISRTFLFHLSLLRFCFFVSPGSLLV